MRRPAAIWWHRPSPQEECPLIALLLDLANIIGGLLLALPLLHRIPRTGDGLVRIYEAVRPYAWVIGVVALVAGGYYLIVHLTSGPHVFHFEVVAIAVGITVLWDRLSHRPAPQREPGSVLAGATLLVAVLGVIAVLVGVQGLLTPN